MSKAYENLPSYTEAMSPNNVSSGSETPQPISSPPAAHYSPYQPAPSTNFIMPPAQHTTTVINTGGPQILLGGCPSCRVGVLREKYTCCAWCCAIFFFPVGILCCLCMKHMKCTNCGATF